MYYKGTTLRGQKVMTINNRGQAGHGKAISIGGTVTWLLDSYQGSELRGREGGGERKLYYGAKRVTAEIGQTCKRWRIL